jgi:hypothetical protein
VTDHQSRSRHGHEVLKNISHGHGRDRDRDRDYRDSRRSRRALITSHLTALMNLFNVNPAAFTPENMQQLQMFV